MKKISLLLLTLLVLVLGQIRTLAQGSTSNKGTEFWTVWMDHIDGTASAMSLYITGDITTSGSVNAADGSFSIPFNITASQVTIVSIPNSAFLSSEGYFNKGIHITSAKNIVVYAHIYHNARSGATLVLPVNAMGKDYYSINYKQTSPSTNGMTGASAFCIIATEDSTSVNITPTATLSSGHAANATFNITLQKGQVYQGLSSTDLTGTRIQSVSSGAVSCKKIAVYSGSSWVTITCTPGLQSADNLFQQVYPTASWGKNYITAPLLDRGYDIYRIIYSDPTANVQLNGTTIPASSLINNFYYEFSSTTPNVITSDKPVQVAQYAVTEKSTINCTNNNTETAGDPEMIFLTPIEQGLDHVSLYSTNNEAITQSYINVIIPTTAAASFILDGAAPASGFTQVPNNTAYSYAQIKVSSGATHNISASTPFNAIAYGFGNVESYGYAAGTDLKNLNEFVQLENPQTNVYTTLGCTGVTYKLQLSLPYTTSSITWDFKDGTTPVTENAVLKSTTVKGTQTLYNYEYSKTVTYPMAGNYTVVATVINSSTDNCGSTEDIELDFVISDTPGAKFSAPGSDCVNDPITFTDETDTKGVAIQSWAWDFGDLVNATANNPNSAVTQNAAHIYSQAGTYMVTLTVTNQNGCASLYQQSIIINPLPKAAFTISTPDCETRDVTFTDNSTTTSGTLVKWVWDFGDGTAGLTKTDNLPFTHQFAVANTYSVSLTVTGSTDCVSNIDTQPVIINPLPVVDFTLPDACLHDSPQFNNKSTIADGTEGSFTYLWDFGDPNAKPANPNTSTLANPTHSFTEERDNTNPYIVSLTVTSKNGCVVTTTHNFTVNGDNPSANFTLDPSNTYCSSDEVTIINQSSVSFGKITLIKVYWDYNGDPFNYTVYQKDSTAAGIKYGHNYGLFNTPGQTKSYAIEMIAYSGSATACSNETTAQIITIKANPVVTLSTVGSICQEAPPVQIIENKNGFTGTGVFNGIGISPTGLFDPAVSGPGTFTINYNFTAANSCGYSTSQQVVVNPTPKADAGGDLNLLQGGSVIIKATASGDMPLTYKWTLTDGSKATGLDHDDVLQPTASPNDNITYMLTVISANGCTASSTMSINVLKAPVVPNTFTPNNDGVNDNWDIKYLDTYPNCTVEVYNRYGEKLYSSIGYPIPWDGTYKGALLPVGTYYYIIDPKNGRKVISGSVTIIR